MPLGAPENIALKFWDGKKKLNRTLNLLKMDGKNFPNLHKKLNELNFRR